MSCPSDGDLALVMLLCWVGSAPNAGFLLTTTMQATPVRRIVASCLRCQASAATASTSTSAPKDVENPGRILAGISRRRPRNDGPAQPEDPAKYLSGYTRSTSVVKPYFDLSAFHKMLDIHPSLTQRSQDGAVSVVWDEPEYSYIDNNGEEQIMKRFGVDKSTRAALEASAESVGGEAANPTTALASNAAVGLTQGQVNGLHSYTLVVNRVVNMTSKGKIPGMYCIVVTGNGNGLVGYGEGKADSLPAARDRATLQAVKNMDYVQRKDQRTTWSDCMTGKWGATVVEIRSRPPGESYG